VTSRHSPRSRIQFGLLSIALGIAVGILAFIVGRADDDAEAAPPRATLVIHGTGDVSLDPGYIPAFGSNGYDWAWSGLGGLFREDDLTIINHECPSTETVAPLEKRFVFRCDPDALDEARRAGVDVASLANNHAFDQGPQALLDSIRNLERADIVPIGAGASQEEADAPAPVRGEPSRSGSDQGRRGRLVRVVW
jgi:Bacterial capsule synthesis protein PGA_cap